MIRTRILVHVEESIECKRVVSRLMNTDEYREYCTWIDTYFSIKRVENTERVVLNLIDTDEYKEGCIWIDTD